MPGAYSHGRRPAFLVHGEPVNGSCTVIVPTDGRSLYDCEEKLSQMLPPMRVGRQRAACIGLQQRHGNAKIGGEEVVVQEVGRADDLPHLLLERLGLVQSQ